MSEFEKRLEEKRHYVGTAGNETCIIEEDDVLEIVGEMKKEFPMPTDPKYNYSPSQPHTPKYHLLKQDREEWLEKWCGT